MGKRLEGICILVVVAATTGCDPRRDALPAAAGAAFAAALPVAEAARPLGGVWSSGHGLLVIDGQGGPGVYTAHELSSGAERTGTLSFDGRKALVEVRELCTPGAAGCLERAFGGEPPTPTVETLRFEQDGAGDRLVGGGETWTRWRLGEPGQVEATAEKLPALEGPSSESPELRVARFVAAQEAKWRAAGLGPTTRLPPGSLPDQDRFRADKAILLARLGRSPDSIVEGFLPARGSVAGVPIAERQVFWQRWAPAGPPSGRVVAIFPGYAQTGRSFADRIEKLSERGDLVYVFDQQWAGFTKGSTPGGVDRGYGVVRDIAADLAFVAREEPGATIVPFGFSLSGGALVGARLLADEGKIQLEGGSMPRGLPAVVENAYFAPTPSSQTRLLEAADAVGAGGLELPADLVVPASCSPDTRAWCSTQVRSENVKVQAATMERVRADYDAFRDLIAHGERPSGETVFIHGDRDMVADPDATRAVATALGDRASFRTLEGGAHSEMRPVAWDLVLRSLAAVSGAR